MARARFFSTNGGQIEAYVTYDAVLGTVQSIHVRNGSRRTLRLRFRRNANTRSITVNPDTDLDYTLPASAAGVLDLTAVDEDGNPSWGWPFAFLGED